MKLEQQVCSLELAQKLFDLGTRQESVFYYHRDTGDLVQPAGNHRMNQYCDYSAFTVAELGEMLSTRENNNMIRCIRAITQWVCDYESYRTMGDTEADARAKMLINLLENNLLTPASQDKE